ncbi:SDR family oxidoreductase [Aestuariispira insulae]|uniref:NADP-dependent 3-hydroxy acid dehydrogenase YdfG n=1 Tax=Aestuariispira insulae TaxID=1461337 RepID=A0A3D9HRF9_9PROT|nr:SDR family oxidoreductase [Aestuariispira insulae]RED52093.1 NADP-dependent 3-hydroxy acid dehydrogenase YdfG [Aestuariispira insulae]
MQDFTGKTALITGASRGIGAAAAIVLAQAGASVMLAARSGDALQALADTLREAGHQADAIACDVADFDQVSDAVHACVNTFGRLDFLINNAGVIDPIDRLGDSDPEDWGRLIDINVKGVYHGMRAALPIMEKLGSGVIVNVSSGAATKVLEGWSAYCASKAAVLSLTRASHLEYADKGIRVVGMSPGTVATDMQREIKKSGINPVSELEWEDHIPAEWAGRAIAFLCSEKAAEFDGGDFSLRGERERQLAGVA